MAEIKVGEYVRCKNGKIAKIKSIKNEFMYFDKEIYWKDGIPIFELENVFKDFIVKYSPEITDLIEKGDYVNGKLIEEIITWQGQKCLFYDVEMPMELGLHFFTEKHIKSIVTKEQFEQIKYIVEE